MVGKYQVRDVPGDTMCNTSIDAKQSKKWMTKQQQVFTVTFYYEIIGYQEVSPFQGLLARDRFHPHEFLENVSRLQNHRKFLTRNCLEVFQVQVFMNSSQLKSGKRVFLIQETLGGLKRMKRSRHCLATRKFLLPTIWG